MTRSAAMLKQKVDIPVYALDWLDNDTVVGAGGGGSTKSGIVSQIQEEKDDDEDSLGVLKATSVSEYPLSSKEDAPMTLAVSKSGTIVTGINQTAETSTASGRAQNKHLRLLDISSTKPRKISPKLQKQVFAPATPLNPEHYQRQTRFNKIKDPTLLAVASTSGEIAILSYPNLESVYSTVAGGDVYDLDFSPADNDMIAYITTKSLHILPFRNSKRVRLQNKKQLQELHEAGSQTGNFQPPSSTVYRCARFLSATSVLCILNDRTAKRAYFGRYVVNIEQGWRQLPAKPLSNKIKAVTGMDVCRPRRMVAVTTSNMAVHIFHMDTFSTLKVVENMADFAITQIKFNPVGSHIACSSVANTVSFIRLEDDLETQKSIWEQLEGNGVYILGVLLLLVALLYLRLRADLA